MQATLALTATAVAGSGGNGGMFCNIPRVDGRQVDAEDWIKTNSSKPVIFTHLIDDWPALKKWDVDGFRREYGHHTLPQTTSTGVHFTFKRQLKPGATTTLGEYVKHVKNQHFIIYDHAETLPILNDIRNDYSIPSILQYASLDNILSFGGAPKGATFQRHQVAWLATIFGRKHWYMADKETAQPPEPECPSHAGDARTQEQWAKHGVIYCAVDPGELIWVPHQWWHATCNGDPYTVAIGGQDFVPFKDFMKTMNADGSMPEAYLYALRGDTARLRASNFPKSEMCSDRSDGTNNAGLWPINLAIKNGYLDVVKLFVDTYGDCVLKTRDGSNRGVVTWAAGAGSVEVLQYLVEEKGLDCSDANNVLGNTVFRGHYYAIVWEVEHCSYTTRQIAKAARTAAQAKRERIEKYLRRVLDERLRAEGEAGAKDIADADNGPKVTPQVVETAETFEFEAQPSETENVVKYEARPEPTLNISDPKFEKKRRSAEVAIETCDMDGDGEINSLEWIYHRDLFADK